MAGFTHIDLRRDVDDRVPANGMDGTEARFATGALGTEAPGLSPFARRRASSREVYEVVEGGGRVKLDCDVADLAPWDAVRVPGRVGRCFEGGPDGIAFGVFGAPPMHDRRRESGLERDRWTDRRPQRAARYDPPSFVVDGGYACPRCP